MDLSDDRPRRLVVTQHLVDLPALAEDAERLFGKADASLHQADLLGIVVAFRVENSAGRSSENAAPTGFAEHAPGPMIAFSLVPAFRQSDRDVNEYAGTFGRVRYQLAETLDDTATEGSRRLDLNEEPACGASVDADGEKRPGFVGLPQILIPFGVSDESRSYGASCVGAA